MQTNMVIFSRNMDLADREGTRSRVRTRWPQLRLPLADSTTIRSIRDTIRICFSKTHLHFSVTVVMDFSQIHFY